MIADGKSKCEQARAYYYEYLCGLSQGATSEEITAHISKCAFCQAEVNRLNSALQGETEKDTSRGTAQKSPLLATNLKLHFAHVGMPVSCITVRPFLPSLADPAFEVGVPTPITVHLDKCQQCSDDLEEIRRLGLSHRQLCRLGQLFSEDFGGDVELCTKAQNVIHSVGDCDFEGVSAEVLRHFCLCPDCRQLLYKYRQGKFEKLSSSLGRPEIACSAVSAADVFDYVVPYGFDSVKKECANFRYSSTEHLASCPECLNKIQKLHSTVYGILQRAESDIVTRFKPDSAVHDFAINSSDNLYEDWPIQVEVFGKSSEEDAELATVATGLGDRGRYAGLRIKPFIKPAAAAAAILLAVLLVFRGPVAKAVDLDRIYKALAKIENIHITTFIPGESGPAQEIWISPALGVKMFSSGSKSVLWDIRGGTVSSKDSGVGSVEITELSEDALAGAWETMDVPWGLLPFNTMSAVRAVSESATWQQVTVSMLSPTVPETRVYDLMWTEESVAGSLIHKKWRGYLDTGTKLPRRIEIWQRLSAQGEYELLIVMEVAYPTADEVQAVIRDTGFETNSGLLRQP